MISYWGHESSYSRSDRRSLPSRVLALTVSNSKYLKQRDQCQDSVMLPLCCALEAILWLWDFLAIDFYSFFKVTGDSFFWFFFLYWISLNGFRACLNLWHPQHPVATSPCFGCFFMGEKFFHTLLTWNWGGFKALGWGGLGVLSFFKKYIYLLIWLVACLFIKSLE